MPKKLLALGSLAAVLLTASPAPAVTPGEDTAVMVDALVLDQAGNPVAGLNRGDFEVIVGDRIRPVSGVQMVATDQAPRRFVFIFNRRGALPAQLKRAQRGLAEFVSSRFGDLDEALFVDFAEVPRITRGWRTGAAEALPEVHNITPMGFQSPAGAAQDAADAAFMLHALAERLAEIPGRKMVILFSGSLSTFAGEPGGALRGTTSVSGWPAVAPPESKPGADTALQSLARRFNASRATVYGLHLEGARHQEAGILVADRQEYNASTGRTLARNTQAGRRQEAFTRPADDFLSSLAAETGGTYYRAGDRLCRHPRRNRGIEPALVRADLLAGRIRRPGRVPATRGEGAEPPGSHRGRAPGTRRSRVAGASNSKPAMSRLPIPIPAARALAAAGAAAQPSASPAAPLVDFLILDDDGKPIEVVSRPMFFAGQLPAGRVFV